VQNVIAEPAQINQAHIKIEQQYAFVQDQWFPTQLNFEVRWKGFPYPATNARKDFGIDAIVMTDEAGEKNNDYWQAARIDSLTRKEKKSYVFIDSLGKEAKLDALTTLSENLLANNQIHLNKIALDLPRLITNNAYEGTRLGVGLHTSDKFSKYINFGGYAGYGFQDKAWKYGADVQLRHPDSRFEPELRIEYFNDLREPAQVYTTSYPVRYVPSPAFFQRTFQASRMDSIQQFYSNRFTLKPTIRFRRGIY